MSGRMVYPGYVWYPDYGGPVTDRPTYLVCGICRNLASVGSAVWGVQETGREVVQGADGDYAAASRATCKPLAQQLLVGVCLVAVDTTGDARQVSLPRQGYVTASVLAVDGDWQLWVDAHRWVLRGLGNLEDAVQAYLNRRAEREMTRTHVAVTKAVPVDTRTVWYCEDCKTPNVSDCAACVGCGLRRGLVEPTPDTHQSAAEYDGDEAMKLLADLTSVRAVKAFAAKNQCVKCGKPFVAADGALMGVGDCCQPKTPPTNP